MPPRAHCRRDSRTSVLAVLACLALSGCGTPGDLGQVPSSLVTDDIHAWVGRDAARSAGGPVSNYKLTDDERMLRDLAFPLIEPPFDRQRWDSVVYEYGLNHFFRRQWWLEDPTVYYAHLQATYNRSSEARYSRLIDDIRNDIVRIEPFFSTARHVVDLDHRREATMAQVANLTPAEHVNAHARIDENSLTIAWVGASLKARCASYRFALEHLAVAEPQPAAADGDRVLAQLTQLIDANQVVIAAAPVTVAVAK